MIPQNVLRQGAPAVYGWLHYHAQQADRLGHQRYYRACRWNGSDLPPGSEPLISLAQRLYRLRNRVAPYLRFYGGGYVPHGLS